MQRKVRLTNEQLGFANTLFELYPDFRPTQSLYLDFEGSGNGHESVISLYWPQNRSPNRFAWRMRSKEPTLTSELILDAIETLGLPGNEVKQIVVYSPGRWDPDERERLIHLFDGNPWPNASWINLLLVTQKSKEMSSAIKTHRNVVFKKDKTQVRHSLEALEWEFKIFRDPSIRSHGNAYRDGAEGKMEVLELIKTIVSGQATEAEKKLLEKYCTQDVKSMFMISRFCERGLFTPKKRAKGRI